MTDNEPNVATLLRTTREEAGYSLHAVADELNIRVRFLEAIESEDFDALPPPAFTGGFVRCYASFLGLEGHGLARQFRARMGAPSLQPELKFPEPVSDSRMPGRSAVLTGLIGMALIYFGWIHDFTGAEQRAAPEVEPVPERFASLGETQETGGGNGFAPADFRPAATRAAAPEATTESEPAARETATVLQAREASSETAAARPETREVRAQQSGAGETVGSDARVTLKAEEDSWIRVLDSRDREVFAGALRAGESWSPPGGGRLTLTTSNAGGLVVTIDGDALSTLGAPGAVVHEVELDPDHLLNAYTLAMH